MKRNINIGGIYNSNNFGKFVILFRNDDDRYTIKFINTGAISTVSSDAIYHGRVKDKFAPVVAGVGYVGSFTGKVTDPNVITFYRSWNDMMNRCYNPTDKDYPMYGAIGIRVDERWHNFGNFFEDAKLLPGYQNKVLYPSIYCLDKDYLQMAIPKENRIYSKNTCMWLSKYDNIIIMNREKSNAQYYGVTKRYNKYVAQYSNTVIGKFSNPEAAANAYNYYFNMHYTNSPLYTVHILNDVPYMSPDEFIKYNTNPKEICKIIK